MPQFKLATFLDPVRGRDAEFNSWYNERHIPDALSLPGMRAAQRFTTGPTFMGRDAPCKYLVIYDIEAASMEQALKVVAEGTATFFVSPAVDLPTVHSYPLTPMSGVRKCQGAHELEISIFFQVDAKDGEVVAQALREVTAPTLAESGCQGLHISRDESDPGRFHVYSRWTDDAAFETHLALAHTRRFFDRVKPLMRETPKTVRLRPLL